MEVVNTNLIFKDFLIHASIFKETPYEKVFKGDSLPHYPVKANLHIHTNKNQTQFKVLLSISSNIEKQLPGYSFQIVGTGYFEIKGIIDNKIKSDYIYGSAVPLTLNSIRSYLYNISSYGRHGKYILPSINLNDMIEKFLSEKPAIKKTKNVKSSK